MTRNALAARAPLKKCFAITRTLDWKYWGTPGRTKMFAICRMGHCAPSPPSEDAGGHRREDMAGSTLILSLTLAGTSLPWRNSSISSLVVISRSSAAATACRVTSSWVGPTPPEVKTTSWSRDSPRSTEDMSSSSSRTTTTRHSSTPASLSCLAAYFVFVSPTRPERISSPTMSSAAVRAEATAASCSACDAGSSLSSHSGVSWRGGSLPARSRLQSLSMYAGQYPWPSDRRSAGLRNVSDTFPREVYPSSYRQQ
mmetsp:Transcript_3172/g.10942  ORF Transcript_3172/g.10942 Transcript_3172/m.10942 type:complete len:255 (+) Transcript_3172:183-947(+)